MSEDSFTSRWAPLIGESFSSGPSVIPRGDVQISLIQLRDKNVLWEDHLGEISSVNFLNVRLPAYVLGERWIISFQSPNETGAGFHVEQYPARIERGSKDRLSISSSSRFVFDDAHRKLVSFNGIMPGLSRHDVRQLLLKKRLRLRVPPEKSGGKWFQKFVPDPGPTVGTFPTGFMRIQDFVTVVDSSSTTDVILRSKAVVRVLTPNFFDLKKWERPVNPYKLTETILSTRMGYQRVESLDQATITSLNWVGPTEYFSAMPAADVSHDPRAREKAFKNLLKDIGREDFNLAADLVQFNQVTRMIAQNLKKVLGAYRAVKRGDFVSASSALFGTRPPKFRRNGGPSARKRASDNWLEYQYGWKPLLNDIADTIEAVHRSYHPSLRTARGSGTVESFADAKINGPFFASLASVSSYPAGLRVLEKKSSCRIGIRYIVSDADKLFLSQTGFTSPLNLAWEVLPFSFVVDWCYPIGPYLERLSAFEGLSFSGGYESYKTVETTGVLVNQTGVHGVFPQRVSIINRGGSQRKAVQFERVKLYAFPSVPGIRLKNPISVKHAANALALLVTGFSRV